MPITATKNRAQTISWMDLKNANPERITSQGALRPFERHPFTLTGERDSQKASEAKAA